MKPQPRHRIASMLTDAYHQLGVNRVLEIEKRTKEALAYLHNDREHYIEVADVGTPEYHITTKHGVICKLIPLARRINQEQKKDHIREHTTVLSLMLSDSGNRFVYCHSCENRYPDPMHDSYTYPVYRYAELETIPKDLRLCSPQDIRPAATELEWEAYGMMFTAFAHLDRSNNINNIPHRTERAMLAYTHIPPQKLTVDGRSYSGKLVLLAQEAPTGEEMRGDHRYHALKELCLFVTPERPYYILKTRHTYRYFRKKICDDVPGGCFYEPTETKRETTYAFVNLSELSKHMHPLYH